MIDASKYGGVLSLFVKFFKKNKFVKFHTFGRKTIRKIWKIEKLREKNVEIMEKKLSPIRMAILVS